MALRSRRDGVVERLGILGPLKQAVVDGGGNAARVKERQVRQNLQVRDRGVEFPVPVAADALPGLRDLRVDVRRCLREPAAGCRRAASSPSRRLRSTSAPPRRSWQTAGCRCLRPWRRRAGRRAVASPPSRASSGRRRKGSTRRRSVAGPSLPGATLSRRKAPLPGRIAARTPAARLPAACSGL